MIEFPATAAAPADLLLTNTLPGTWIFSRFPAAELEQKKRERQRGHAKKCVFEDMSLFIQSLKVGFIIYSLTNEWKDSRAKGSLVKSFSPLRETLKAHYMNYSQSERCASKDIPNADAI